VGAAAVVIAVAVADARRPQFRGLPEQFKLQYRALSI
jgi:hypothetical protein